MKSILQSILAGIGWSFAAFAVILVLVNIRTFLEEHGGTYGGVIFVFSAIAALIAVAHYNLKKG